MQYYYTMQLVSYYLKLTVNTYIQNVSYVQTLPRFLIMLSHIQSKIWRINNWVNTDI